MIPIKLTKTQIKELVKLLDQTIWNLDDRIKFAPTTQDAKYHINQRDLLKVVEARLRKEANIYEPNT